MTGSEGRGEAEPRKRGGWGAGEQPLAGEAGGESPADPRGEGGTRAPGGRSQLGGQGSGAPGGKGRGRGGGSGDSRALQVRARPLNRYY